jgi:acyl-CoA-binding protein
MSKSKSSNVLSGLNAIPAVPGARLISDYATFRLAAAGANDTARNKLAPLVDKMQANGWISDMLRVSWIKDQSEAQRDAYIAFRDSVIRATIKAMPIKAREMIEADKDTIPTGESRDRTVPCMGNRKYWQQQTGSVVSDIMSELDRRKEQASKDKRAAELKDKPDAEAIKAQDALMERVNAIIAAAAQSIKALDKVAKAADEPVDSKSRVGKLASKLRSVVKSGADFGIASE